MRTSAIAITIITAAALSLAACGSENEGEFTTEDGETGEYTIDSDSGEASMTIDTPDGEVSMRTGPDTQIDLPDGFSIVSGADIVSTTIIDQADGRGALVLFKTDMTPEDVAEHYRAEAEAADIEIQIETSINGGRMLGGESASGTTFSVTAYPSEDEEAAGAGGQTMVQLVVGQG